MSNKAAKIVRDALKKEMGLSSAHVSVRSAPCGGSTKIRVTIKVPCDGRRVEAISKRSRYEHICDKSGDLLLGGNTYVTVSYDESVWKAKAAAAAALFAEAEADPGRFVHLPGGFFVVYYPTGFALGYRYPEFTMPDMRYSGAGGAAAAYAKAFVEVTHAGSECAG